jgi:hypothetical protein
MASISDPFWYNNITILWNNDRLTEFFPSQDNTLEEKFNALVRLSFYCFIILYFYKNDSRYIYLPFGVMLLTYYIYNNREMESFDILPTRDTVLEKENELVQKTSLDANVFDNKSQQISQEIKEINKTEELKECTQPTIDNPFMNVTMKDYLNIDPSTNIIFDRPPACDTNNPEIQEKIETAFGNNLFKDVNDIFGKTNSQRQFYTMPSTTIPNGQMEFAKWLYLNPKTCKEDQDYCNPYEDLRAKRPVVYDSTKNPVKKD